MSTSDFLNSRRLPLYIWLAFRKEAFIFPILLRRASLACAVALTIALLWVSIVPFWASIVPSVGQTLGAKFHQTVHLISFAVLGITWTWAVVRTPIPVIGLSVIGFAVFQEVIEIYGHAHSFEMHDVVIDALGASIGVIFAYVVKKYLGMK